MHYPKTKEEEEEEEDEDDKQRERRREKCCATRVNVKWLSSEEREKDGGEKKNEK